MGMTVAVDAESRLGGMLVSACVLPHPPVLVPEVAVQSPSWLGDLRKTCIDTLTRTLAAEVDTLVVVGGADRPGQWDGSAGGSMAAYGVDVAFGGVRTELPLSLTIAAHLLDEVDWRGIRAYVAVDRTSPPAARIELGRSLAAGQRTALVVMGDGSAKRSKQAPGYFDERAARFDAEAVSAIAATDPQAISALDPQVAQELWVAGLPAWQVLAGALDGRYAARVDYDEAPTGVGYFVIGIGEP
jgi:hypothetical protein